MKNKTENLAVISTPKLDSNYGQTLMIQLLSILDNEKCEGEYFKASFYEFAVQKKLMRIVGLIGDSIQKYNFQAYQPSLSEQDILKKVDSASLNYFNNITQQLEFLFRKLAEENCIIKGTRYSNQFLMGYREANDKKYSYNERIEKINAHFEKNDIRFSFIRFDDFVKNTWYENSIKSKNYSTAILIEEMFSSAVVKKEFENEVNKQKEKKSKLEHLDYDSEKARTLCYQQFIQEEVQAICLVSPELLKSEEKYLVFSYPGDFLDTCKKFTDIIYEEENKLKLQQAGFPKKLPTLPAFRKISFKQYDIPKYHYHPNYEEKTKPGTQDYKTAREYLTCFKNELCVSHFTKAAEQEYPAAYLALFLIYAPNTFIIVSGVAKNEALGNKYLNLVNDNKEWFKAEAKRGDSDAQINLALVYLINNDIENFNHYLDLAIQKNDSLAYFYKGYFFYKVMKDKQIALDYFKEASRVQPNELALFYMARCLLEISKDTEQAIDILENAADKGHSPSQKYLADYYRDRQSYDKAFRYYKSAASQANHIALFGLGLVYQTGLGVEKNPKKAKECFEQAVKQTFIARNEDSLGNKMAYLQENHLFNYLASRLITKDAQEDLDGLLTATCSGDKKYSDHYYGYIGWLLSFGIDSKFKTRIDGCIRRKDVKLLSCMIVNSNCRITIPSTWESGVFRKFVQLIACPENGITITELNRSQFYETEKFRIVIQFMREKLICKRSADEIMDFLHECKSAPNNSYYFRKTTSLLEDLFPEPAAVIFSEIEKFAKCQLLTICSEVCEKKPYLYGQSEQSNLHPVLTFLESHRGVINLIKKDTTSKGIYENLNSGNEEKIKQGRANLGEMRKESRRFFNKELPPTPYIEYPGPRGGRFGCG